MAAMAWRACASALSPLMIGRTSTSEMGGAKGNSNTV